MNFLHRLAALPSHPHLPRWLRPLQSAAVRASLWTFTSYGASQVLRLASNLILTRLLFKEAFGIMLVVNLVLQGFQMLSDLGIAPSIVQNPKGEDPDFLRTAWTLQILRGCVLYLAGLILCYPLSLFFHEPVLVYILPVIGLGIIIDSLGSPNAAVLNRRLHVGPLVTLDLAAYVLAVVVMVGSALLVHQNGVLVTEVDIDSPGARAGLMVGDVVVGLNGQRTDHATDLGEILESLQADTPVNAAVLREKARVEIALPPLELAPPAPEQTPEEYTHETTGLKTRNLGTVWPLVFGNLMYSLTYMLATHTLIKGPRMRLLFNRELAMEIIRFGGWLFLSSMLAFAAGQLGNILLGHFLTTEALGVYSIAFMMSQVLLQVVQKLASKVLFPLYAQTARDNMHGLRRQMRKVRTYLLLGTLPPMWVMILIAPELIQFLYDPRYHEAGWMLQILAIGATIQCVLYPIECVLMSVGDSYRHMLLQTVRTFVLFMCMMIGGHFFGTYGYIVGFALSSILYYPALVALVRRYNVWLPEMDLLAFAATAGVVAVGLFLRFELGFHNFWMTNF